MLPTEQRNGPVRLRAPARAQSPRSSRSRARIWVPTQRNKKTCFNPYADWLASLLARARRTHSGGTRFSSRVAAAGGDTRECRGSQTGVPIRRRYLLVRRRHRDLVHGRYEWTITIIMIRFRPQRYVSPFVTNVGICLTFNTRHALPKDL